MEAKLMRKVEVPPKTPHHPHKTPQHTFKTPHHPSKPSCKGGSGELQDSGFLISPPNQVTYSSSEEVTPRPYFLRGQPKYSSTPLLPGGSAIAPNHLTSINLEERLEELQEQQDVVEPDEDSGFCTLTSSLDSTSPSQPPTSPRPLPHNLGALPKRRSPRNISKNIDGIARLTRLKSGRHGSDSASCSSLGAEARIGSFTNFSDGGSSFPPSQKRVLFKYDPRRCRAGRETLDIAGHLFEMNLRHVLDTVFQYCSGTNLCAIAQVSQTWNVSLSTSKLHDGRRLAFIQSRKLDQENHGSKLRLGADGVTSPRRAMQCVTNNRSPGQAKRDRGTSCTTLVSPSKIRHRLFVDAGRTLSPGERLTQCPVCTSPSRVAGDRAQCSSDKCGFTFCPDCLCQEHEGRGCRVTRTGSKVPKSGAVTSKKSKARLRRL